MKNLLKALVLFASVPVAVAEVRFPVPIPSDAFTSAAADIAAIKAEKTSRTAAQQKIDAELVVLVRQQRGEATALAVPVPKEPYVERVVATGRLTVEIRGAISESLTQAIVSHGGVVKAIHEKYGQVIADLPLASLEPLAARGDVEHIHRFVPPSHNALQGAQDAVIAHAVEIARNRFGLTGAGVRVGVISDSADFLAELQAAGEMPEVNVLEAGQGEGEGTAMLQIVSAVAPNAELYFMSDNFGFSAAVDRLVSENVDIIIDDLSLTRASPFQPSISAQVVQDAVDAGILYFSSAGNFGNFDASTSTVYRGEYNSAMSPPELGLPPDIHVYPDGNGVATTLANGEVCLFWNDPLGASTNDYDLLILDANFNVVGSSTNTQNGAQDPIECVPNVLFNQYVLITRVSGEARFMHLAMNGYDSRPAFSYITAGAIRGHQALEDVFAVAATNVDAPTSPLNSEAVIASYSGDGNPRWYYQADGTPITPGNLTSTGGQVIMKPDITAASGIRTSVPDPFDVFFGTSASAPIAGAIAALMLEANPDLTVESMREIFAATAIDIGPPGPDVTSGYGIITATGVLEFMFRRRTVPMVGGGFAAVLLLGIVRLASRARARG